MTREHPLVAVSCGYHVDTKGREVMTVYAHYLKALRAAGAIPVAVPPVADAAEAEVLLTRLDGLLLVGGDDINPDRFGQALHPKAELMHPKREASDFALIGAADRLGLPMMGICLGCQEINVARGGTLHQHLPDVPTVKTAHSGAFPNRARHTVRVQAGSNLAAILARDELDVNRAHHQAVAEIGSNLKPTAYSADGVVEALEGTDAGRFVLAVQWHPEEIADRPEQAAVFARFVQECRNRRK
jgi:putative glutamine amidotransferase